MKDYSDYYENIISRYASKGLIIDTNVLLLYIFGSFDIDKIEKWEKTNMFTPKDFQILLKIVEQFHCILLTPQITAELTNFLPAINNRRYGDYSEVLKEIIIALKEKYTHKDTLIASEFLPKFGFTDISIFELATQGYMVLTAEFPLYGLLVKQNLPCINFNHLRDYQVK